MLQYPKKKARLLFTASIAILNKCLWFYATHKPDGGKAEIPTNSKLIRCNCCNASNYTTVIQKHVVKNMCLCALHSALKSWVIISLNQIVKQKQGNGVKVQCVTQNICTAYK